MLSPGLDASTQKFDAASTLASTTSLDSLDAASTLHGPRVVTLCATGVKAASKMPRRLDAGLDALMQGLDDL